MKLSKIYKSLLKENNSLTASTERDLQKIGKSLSNNKKVQSIVLNAFKKNPKAFDILDKKIGKILPISENDSDFSLNLDNLEKLSLDLSKNIDIEINESLKDTLKVALKVLKLLGIGSMDDVIMTIIKEVIEDRFIDAVSAGGSSTLNSIALIITIATVVLSIIRNARKNNLKSAI